MFIYILFEDCHFRILVLFVPADLKKLSTGFMRLKEGGTRALLVLSPHLFGTSSQLDYPLSSASLFHPAPDTLYSAKDTFRSPPFLLKQMLNRLFFSIIFCSPSELQIGETLLMAQVCLLGLIWACNIFKFRSFNVCNFSRESIVSGSCFMGVSERSSMVCSILLTRLIFIIVASWNEEEPDPLGPGCEGSPSFRAFVVISLAISSVWLRHCLRSSSHFLTAGSDACFSSASTAASISDSRSLARDASKS
ncbi:hypothetical protein Cgig2_001391 [Carnegiea gigantea]|uniref:Uncharacterized protein n=1 Tax=Carnegiea gigantea TaxID=171969 RepID=A0A9Q1KTU1_9CARY|nr:hypothetical protein Cgig2_001391 [Carnegiea gigantea]